MWPSAVYVRVSPHPSHVLWGLFFFNLDWFDCQEMLYLEIFRWASGVGNLKILIHHLFPFYNLLMFVAHFLMYCLNFFLVLPHAASWEISVIMCFRSATKDSFNNHRWIGKRKLYLWWIWISGYIRVHCNEDRGAFACLQPIFMNLQPWPIKYPLLIICMSQH